MVSGYVNRCGAVETLFVNLLKQTVGFTSAFLIIMFAKSFYQFYPLMH